MMLPRQLQNWRPPALQAGAPAQQQQLLRQGLLHMALPQPRCHLPQSPLLQGPARQQRSRHLPPSLLLWSGQHHTLRARPGLVVPFDPATMLQPRGLSPSWPQRLELCLQLSLGQAKGQTRTHSQHLLPRSHQLG